MMLDIIKCGQNGWEENNLESLGEAIKITLNAY
jgi:hypothetical protein